MVNYKFGDPIGDKSYVNTILGMPIEFEYFEAQTLGHPIMQMGGFFLFDWIKKLFASPITRGVVAVAKKAAPVLERAVLGEIGKTEKGKEIADVYGKAKTIGSKLYDVGKDVYSAVKEGSGEDPAYKMAQIIEEAYAKKGSGLNVAGGTINPADLERLVSSVYVPQLIKNLKGSGVKLHKKYTATKAKKLRAAIRKSLKKQKGGFWAALLPLLSTLLPVGAQLAENIVPLISNLLSPKGSKIGSGASKELNNAVGKEIAQLLQKYMKSGDQLGKGFFDTLRNIGSTVMDVIRKIFPVAKNIFQKVAPVLEPAVLEELGRTEKGQRVADIYSKGKKISKDIYSAFQE